MVGKLCGNGKKNSLSLMMCNVEECISVYIYAFYRYIYDMDQKYESLLCEPEQMPGHFTSDMGRR